MPGQRAFSTFLVEHYRPGMAAAELEECVAQLRRLAREQAAGPSSPRITLSVTVPADEAFLVLVEAGSEQAVHDLYREAEVDFDRVSAVVAAPGPAHVEGSTRHTARTSRPLQAGKEHR
jgi:hypothetical protein